MPPDLARPSDDIFMWLYEYKPLKISHDLAKSSGHKHCDSGDLARPHDQRVLWPYGWGHFMVCDNPTKFCGHRHCGSGDIVLVCYLI